MENRGEFKNCQFMESEHGQIVGNMTVNQYYQTQQEETEDIQYRYITGFRYGIYLFICACIFSIKIASFGIFVLLQIAVALCKKLLCIYFGVFAFSLFLSLFGQVVFPWKEGLIISMVLGAGYLLCDCVGSIHQWFLNLLETCKAISFQLLSR